ILLLVLLPVAGGSAFSSSGAELAWDIALIFIKLAALVILSFFAGKYIIPSMLSHVSRLQSRELFTLTILTVALGIAVGSSLLFGASMALGAFIAGMIVGQSDYSTRAASEALPMRDAFAVLFFVSVGMMFDPTTFTDSLPLLFSVLAVVLIGKPLAAFIVIRALGRPVSSSLKISSALAQIGEFTFIVASTAIAMKMMPAGSMNVLVGVSIITIALNPALYQGSVRLARLWEKKQSINPSGTEQISPDPAAHSMIIVGYGPVGQTLHRILSDNGIQVTVIEMNLETAKKLKQQGVAAIYGDALSAETLIQAGIEQAASLIVSVPGIQGDAITQGAKALNPRIRVVIRTHFLSELPGVKKSGADAVFAGEGEIA
ncbi:MAG: cation:proton antiporter, partial [Spirochaetota bacterium]